MENTLALIYLKCDDMIEKRFALKNSGISCDSCLVLIFNLNNPKMKILYVKIGSRLQVCKIGQFIPVLIIGRLILIYGLVVTANRCKQGTWV